MRSGLVFNPQINMTSNTPWEFFIKAQLNHEAPIASEQLSALSNLFVEPKSSIPEIARQITAPILRALEKEPDAPVDCYRLWRTIADAVKDLTEFNDKLVELVVEIQKVPDSIGYIAHMQDFRQYWTEFAFNCGSLSQNLSPFQCLRTILTVMQFKTPHLLTRNALLSDRDG
jgi:hypothetical protein